MRFSTSFFVLSAACCTFLLPATAAANPVAGSHVDANEDVYGLGGLQQQVPIGDIAPTTRTRTVTETQTFFEVVETVYMTKPKLVPTWVAVSQEVEGGEGCNESASKEETKGMVQGEGAEECDETKEISCAVCRTIHQCGEFEEGCTPCDSAPACAACQPALPPKKEVLPPTIHLGMTCSLGPGRTVPCELVNKDGVKGPVYRFGEDA